MITYNKAKIITVEVFRRCTVTNDLIFLKETGDSYTGDRRKITWGENPHVMREHPR
ncbi:MULTISPECIES: hypothetical protein [unclassified Okeania]|uniref:hypothetical protein n=1 Tax=unclassified Okeania TaxID=2634635 RepID=UPI0013BC4AD4|nr:MULTISPECIES: hypothetical protein [unclassified Okeania]NES78957.1 hypothetical protein [Okeania sp. SIO1H4]NET15803.1 hypothetical protein [Okeania sp. SIO1H6]NET22554.1 hypothetical protein [Okeania sp. SIO1H5]NET95679.1 hypothetical protein [Okeania sp. SIO1H2]